MIKKCSYNCYKNTLFFLCCLINFPVICQEKTETKANTLSASSKVLNIKEVEVIGRLKDANIKSGSTGLSIDVKELKLLPRFFGESDPFKTLQYIGGVSQASEANAGLYVRGGNNDQNLILLNGTSIQNPTHVLGMFSVFNPDLIGQMQFIKSGIPAEYGGRLSSIVDISSSTSVPEKFDLKGSIGLISSRLCAQIRLTPKFSIYASWRGSYISSVVLPAMSLLGTDSILTQNKYEFWDANAGFNYNISPRTKLSGHLYVGNDEISIGTFSNYNIQKNSTIWGNTAAGIQLKTSFNDDWSLQQQLNFSKFNIQSVLNWSTDLLEPTTLQSQFQSVHYKAIFFHTTNNHSLKFGTEISDNNAMPNLIRSDSTSSIEFEKLHNNLHSVLLSVFARDEWNWKKFQFNLGIRANVYAQIGPYTDFQNNNTLYTDNSIIKTYTGLEPRFYTRYLMDNNTSLKVSATRIHQYLNQIPVFSIGIPSDLQIPASLYVAPQASWHFSGGYFRNLNNDAWEFSIEAYYKTLENQLEYNNGITTSFNNSMFEKNLLVGKGWTYGTELKVRKNYGKFTGWATYNLAWSYRQFEKINNGLPYLAQNDRRHDLSVIGMYQLNDRLSFSTVFVYATGNRLNLPVSWFIIDNKIVLEYGKYNAFEMPAYHRLDISANYKLKKWHNIDSEINFSVYNVYNRANPYQLKFDVHYQQIFMNYLLPVLPSVSWTFHLN